jgi:hypothetical protein
LDSSWGNNVSEDISSLNQVSDDFHDSALWEGLEELVDLWGDHFVQEELLEESLLHVVGFSLNLGGPGDDLLVNLDINDLQE